MFLLFSLLAACSSQSVTPAVSSTPPSPPPRTRPVPEREVRAMADTLVGLARNRGFNVVALQRALEEGNSVDVCRSLGLAPTPCEVLGARANDLGERIDVSGVINIGGPPPRGCSDGYIFCVQAALVAAAKTGRSAAIIAGLVTLGVLKCRCALCARGWLGQVCDAIEGI